MDKLIPIHYSLSDWDFSAPSKWQLITDRFVSAPTALSRLLDEILPTFGVFFLGDALGLNIPEGRIVHQFWRQIILIQQLHYYFRVQAKNGDNIPDDCYYIYLYGNVHTLTYRLGGVNQWSHEHNCPDGIPQNQWTQLRLTWFTFINEFLNTVFRVVFEIKVDGVWKEQWHDDSEENAWADSAANRVGFAHYNSFGGYYFIQDDTEIWEKA